MQHSDIVPEHDCGGKLIDSSNSKCVTKMWSWPCGTEFSYEPDSTWV
jgi:hypothetical protein